MSPHSSCTAWGPGEGKEGERKGGKEREEGRERERGREGKRERKGGKEREEGRERERGRPVDSMPCNHSTYLTVLAT